MKRVLVNATNLTGSGATAIGLSLLPSLVQSMPESSFTLLLPDEAAFHAYTFPDNAQNIFFSRKTGLSNDIARLRELLWLVPRLARRLKADLCLTLGDLTPLALQCPHVLFLHQSLLVYNKGELAGLGGWSVFKNLYIRSYFAVSVRRDSWVVVQTPIMAGRLTQRYGIQSHWISVIPQPIPLHVLVEAKETTLHPRIVECDKPIKLLFLAQYYPHKNHAILPLVAKELRRRGLADRVEIFLTLDEALLSTTPVVEWLNQYLDVITNLGSLPRSDVASAFRASTALFLPTLVESFGLIYLEAMACGTPIVTSDRDFARWMCQDLALYFDPVDPASIVDIIETLPTLDLAAYRNAAAQNLERFPKNWDDVAHDFVRVLDHAIGER